MREYVPAGDGGRMMSCEKRHRGIDVRRKPKKARAIAPPRQRRHSILAWGHAPAFKPPRKPSAESATQFRGRYRFFSTHALIRSKAFSMFSMEFATLKRR